MLKMALLAPTPSANVSTAAAVKPGLRASSRKANRISRVSRSRLFQPQTVRLSSPSRVALPNCRRAAKSAVAGSIPFSRFSSACIST